MDKALDPSANGPPHSSLLYSATTLPRVPLLTGLRRFSGACKCQGEAASGTCMSRACSEAPATLPPRASVGEAERCVCPRLSSQSKSDDSWSKLSDQNDRLAHSTTLVIPLRLRLRLGLCRAVPRSNTL